MARIGTRVNSRGFRATLIKTIRALRTRYNGAMFNLRGGSEVGGRNDERNRKKAGKQSRNRYQVGELFGKAILNIRNSSSSLRLRVE